MTLDNLRELDAKVAEQVMGWAWVHSCVPPVGDSRYRSNGMCWAWLSPNADQRRKHLTGQEEKSIQNVSLYSSDISAAFSLVEAMRAKGFTVCIETVRGRWSVEFADTGYNDIRDESLPLAICKAALAKLAETATPPSAVPTPSLTLPPSEPRPND